MTEVLLYQDIVVGGAHLQIAAGGVEMLEEAQHCSLWTRDTGIWLLQVG